MVALEAWRRGLRVSIGARGHYTVSSSEVSHTFRLSRLAGTKEIAQAVRICNDKTKTKEYLQRADVPVPPGNNFRNDLEFSEVAAFAEEIGFPVCLKANGWSKGKGVFSCLKNSSEFSKYYKVLVEELGCNNLCVEKFVPGDDCRVYVVGDKVVAAARRVPANVVGDGINTIRELIELKNAEKKRNPYLQNCLISLDFEVKDKISSAGYCLESVLPEGELLYLRDKSNASAGGDSIDVTDVLSRKMITTAVSAIAAIPGLSHGGVDILSEDVTSESSNTTVLEINQAAEIGFNAYPFVGEPRQLYKDVVSYYFPETTEKLSESYSNWYFNLRGPLNLIKNRAAAAVEIGSLPDLSNLTYAAVDISGAFSGRKLMKVIASQARKLGVHGQIRRAGSSTLQIKVAASKATLDEFMRELRKLEHADLTKKLLDPFDCVIGFYVSSFVDDPAAAFDI